MNFEFHYTEEQEKFRKEVSAFIEEHAYKEPIVPADTTRLTPEIFLRNREIQRKLDEKG